MAIATLPFGQKKLEIEPPTHWFVKMTVFFSPQENRSQAEQRKLTPKTHQYFKSDMFAVV